MVTDPAASPALLGGSDPSESVTTVPLVDVNEWRRKQWPGWLAPSGWHFEWQQERPDHWRATARGRRCRYMERRAGCGRPAVAEFKRGVKGDGRDWWAYCSRHLYGRYMAPDGTFWMPALVADVAS